MAVYSKFLSLITGADRTVDLGFGSGNSLGIADLQFLGSTSGTLDMKANGTTTPYTIVWPAAQSSGANFLKNDGAGNLSWSPAGSGTVTSVAFTDGSMTPIFTVSGSPITTSGTITNTLATQAANSVFAGPTTGVAAQPTFRTLVVADIPSLSSLYLALSGGTMSGAINMGTNKITNLGSPTVSTDAATKGYVDAAISGLTWQGPAQAYAASNVSLTGGATLTIDGYSVQNGDLVLLANQSTASQNGEYAVSGIGTAYTLTPNGLPTVVGDAWLVTHGTMYGNSAFVATAVVPAATFIEFAGPQALVYSAPLSISGNTVSISQATTSTNGYLTSTDWNTFNNKQPAGSYITALTGDATASGPGSAALTLATVNSNVGSFTNASVTVNAKGLVTAASSGPTTSTGIVTSETAGEAFAATTLFAVRWAKAGDAGLVAGRVYKADNDTTSADNFYAVGLVFAPGSVSAAGAITVTEAGLINAPSHGFTVGAPLFLGAAGAITETAPSAALSAVVRVGTVKDANNIFVNIQTVGVN